MNPIRRAVAAAAGVAGMLGGLGIQAGTPGWQVGLRPERLSGGVGMALEQAAAGIRSRAARPQDAPVAATADPRVGPNVACGPDPMALPAGFRAQAEPHVARHPSDPDFLLATFQDGRFSDGGAVTCGYAVSRDGGLSWVRSLIPRAARVDGGFPDRATDPVAAFSPDGATLYLNTLGIAGMNLETGILQLSRSTNGGASFLPPVEIYRSPTSAVFPDKNWMVVNAFKGTSSYRRIVVTFTRFEGFDSPIAVTHSDDDGLTWSAPVLATARDAQCQGSQPVFLPDGRLLLVYWDFVGDGDTDQAIRAVVSSDGGATFGPPVTVVAGIDHYDDPTVRDGVFLPSAAVDPSTGAVYVSYQAYVGVTPRVLVVKSTDGGKSWGVPKVVSDNPPTASVFNPALAVSPDGRSVMVAFWDKRAGGDDYRLDTWVAQSTDAGATWLPNLRVTTVSTDVRLSVATGRGYMIGDYLGLVAPADALTAAVALTIDTRTGEPQPLSARFGAGGVLTFDNWRASRFSRAFNADPARGGEQADADDDGIPLLGEYAFGTDPAVADRVAARMVRTGVPLLAFPFNAAASDVRVDAESSADLSHWVPLAGSTASGAGPTAVIPVGDGGPSLFFRARAVRK